MLDLEVHSIVGRASFPSLTYPVLEKQQLSAAMRISRSLYLESKKIQASLKIWNGFRRRHYILSNSGCIKRTHTWEQNRGSALWASQLWHACHSSP